MKILVVGTIHDGFRFYGPIPEGRYGDLATLEEARMSNPEDAVFYATVEPIPATEFEELK